LAWIAADGRTLDLAKVNAPTIGGAMIETVRPFPFFPRPLCLAPDASEGVTVAGCALFFCVPGAVAARNGAVSAAVCFAISKGVEKIGTTLK
jgi:hypothetical protein